MSCLWNKDRAVREKLELLCLKCSLAIFSAGLFEARRRQFDGVDNRLRHSF